MPGGGTRTPGYVSPATLHGLVAGRPGHRPNIPAPGSGRPRNIGAQRIVRCCRELLQRSRTTTRDVRTARRSWQLATRSRKSSEPPLQGSRTRGATGYPNPIPPPRSACPASTGTPRICPSRWPWRRLRSVAAAEAAGPPVRRLLAVEGCTIA